MGATPKPSSRICREFGPLLLNVSDPLPLMFEARPLCPPLFAHCEDRKGRILSTQITRTAPRTDRPESTTGLRTASRNSGIASVAQAERFFCSSHDDDARLAAKSRRRGEQARKTIEAPKPRRPEQHLRRVCADEGRFEVYKGPTAISFYCELRCESGLSAPAKAQERERYGTGFTRLL